jgi:ribosomal protein L39E
MDSFLQNDRAPVYVMKKSGKVSCDKKRILPLDTVTNQ